MTNKVFLIFYASIILLSIATNILSIFRIKSLNTDMAIKDNMIQEMNISENRLSYLENCVNFNLLYGNQMIIDKTAIDTNEVTHHINGVVGDSPVLVFRYSETNCQDCILFGALKLSNHYKDMECKPVLFASYSAFHLFKTRVPTFNMEHFSAYNVTNVSRADKNNAPYYFILNPDKTMSDIFVPEKVYPGMTDDYFDKIDCKYSFN